MSTLLKLIVFIFASVFFGCSSQRNSFSDERRNDSYLKREEQAYSIYSTGSVQRVEKELLALLMSIDEYHAKEPHVFQYDWNRGVAQGRLALLYRHQKRTSKADEYMSRSIASFKRLEQNKLKGVMVKSKIDESWVIKLVEVLDAPLNPSWRVLGSAVKMKE